MSRSRCIAILWSLWLSLGGGGLGQARADAALDYARRPTPEGLQQVAAQQRAAGRVGDAAALLARAHESFASGRYLEAAERYAELYALRRLPRALFNIAQALRRAQRPAEARAFYQRFLEEEPPGPLHEEARSYLRELQAVTAPPRPVVLVRPEVRRDPPLYRRPWFWVVMGGAVALSGVVLGVALSRDSAPPAPMRPVVGPFPIEFP